MSTYEYMVQLYIEISCISDTVSPSQPVLKCFEQDSGERSFICERTSTVLRADVRQNAKHIFEGNAAILATITLNALEYQLAEI